MYDFMELLLSMGHIQMYMIPLCVTFKTFKDVHAYQFFYPQVHVGHPSPAHTTFARVSFRESAVE